MAKVLRCRDAGMDCDVEIQAQSEQAILDKAVEHAKTAHNVKEISPEVAQKVRAAIHDID